METDRQLPPRNAHRAAAVDRVAQVLADRLPPLSLPGHQLQAAADAATSAVIQELRLERRYRVTVGRTDVRLAEGRREEARTLAAALVAREDDVRVSARYVARWRPIPVDLDQPAQAIPATA